MSIITIDVLFETCWTPCKKPHLSSWSRTRFTFFWSPHIFYFLRSCITQEQTKGRCAKWIKEQTVYLGETKPVQERQKRQLPSFFHCFLLKCPEGMIRRREGCQLCCTKWQDWTATENKRKRNHKSKLRKLWKTRNNNNKKAINWPLPSLPDVFPFLLWPMHRNDSTSREKATTTSMRMTT